MSDYTVPVYKARLQKNYSSIIASIIPKDIVDYLITCDVLTIGDGQIIDHCESEGQKNRKLMDKLLRTSEEGFGDFLKALREDTEYKDLADQIENTKVTHVDISTIQSCNKYTDR